VFREEANCLPGLTATKTMAKRIVNIPITTINSIKVKPLEFSLGSFGITN
jgi:hypothetical protein